MGPSYEGSSSEVLLLQFELPFFFERTVKRYSTASPGELIDSRSMIPDSAKIASPMLQPRTICHYLIFHSFDCSGRIGLP